MKATQLVIAIALCVACSDTTTEPAASPRRPNPNDLNQPSGEPPITNEQTAPTATAPTGNGAPTATTPPPKTGSRASRSAADFDQAPHDTNNNTNHGVEPSLVSPKPINTGDPCSGCK